MLLPMLTNHARIRLSQRNLSLEDVAFVRQNGVRINRAGVSGYFLGTRHLRTHADARRYSHLVGTVVLCCPHCGCVLTAYRNRVAGNKGLRRKAKYNRTPSACPICRR